MTCERARAQLMAFVDRELESDAAYEVSWHVASCTECGAEVAALRALDGEIRGACRLDEAEAAAFEGVRARALRALGAEVAKDAKKAGRRRSRLAAVAGIAAAILLAVGLGIGLVPRPAAAAFASDHIMCLHMRSDWVIGPDAAAIVLRAEMGGGAVLPRFEGRAPAKASVCEIAGRHYVHIVYEGPGGPPFSLYVGRRTRATPGAPATTLVEDKDGPLSVVRVPVGGDEYALVTDPARAAALGAELWAHLASSAGR